MAAWTWLSLDAGEGRRDPAPRYRCLPMRQDWTAPQSQLDSYTLPISFLSKNTPSLAQPCCHLSLHHLSSHQRAVPATSECPSAFTCFSRLHPFSKISPVWRNRITEILSRSQLLPPRAAGCGGTARCRTCMWYAKHCARQKFWVHFLREKSQRDRRKICQGRRQVTGRCHIG